MCETPLETRYMLRETEARARSLARNSAAEDAALANVFARLTWMYGKVAGKIAAIAVKVNGVGAFR
jgi:hypothetical protein